MKILLYYNTSGHTRAAPLDAAANASRRISSILLLLRPAPRVRVRVRVRVRFRVAASRRYCCCSGLRLITITVIVMLCYVMVPLLPPINCVEDSWRWQLHATSASGRRAPAT
jgi:hypothetical protein